MKKILVTGLNGFVGRHFQALLASTHGGHWQLIKPKPYNLLDSISLDACLQDERPEAVIHLAGQTFVPESFRDPAQTFQTNLLGTLNLLQALKRRGFCGTFLYVSSGDVYGQVDESNLPIRESLAPRPRNPYAVSKVSAELLCQQWGYSEPWRIIIARPFNHIGSGQGENFVIPSMARQLISMRHVQSAQIKVGDVNVTRDFLDVNDVLQAYLVLLEHGRNGEIYNVCSGVERSVHDLIMQMASMVGVKVELVPDPSRIRFSEQRRVVGCSHKLQSETGWKPTISIKNTLEQVIFDCEIREHKNV